MSIDRSLKLKGALARHRNVLTRAERILRLKDEEKWDESKSVFGLVKVANRKVSVSKKKEAKAAAAEGTDAAVAAPAAGKGAAPAAKAAAPAGKAAPAAKPAGGKK